jgi:hypothetical protein
MREASSGHPDHAPRIRVARPTTRDPRPWLVWAYRRIAFIWNYPASMNLFCVALAIDAVRAIGGGAGTGALAVPVLIAIFGPTLAAKQVAHAIRLLRPSDWR